MYFFPEVIMMIIIYHGLLATIITLLKKQWFIFWKEEWGFVFLVSRLTKVILESCLCISYSTLFWYVFLCKYDGDKFVGSI